MSTMPVLALKGITKHFGPVEANRNVNFTLKRGEIHGVLGENGAGKSTLMNVISGIYQPDGGDIYIDGRKTVIRSTREALDTGIGMVHQHFMLIPVFSVIENIMLCEKRVLGFQGTALNRKKTRRKLAHLSSRFALNVDPDAVVETLPVGVQQRIEILKALYHQARILILDEPTAVLAPQEADELFKVMKALADQEVSIVFITHKLGEVMDVADRITVMRRGRVVSTIKSGETSIRHLARMMVGRDIHMAGYKKPVLPGPVILDVRQLTVKTKQKADRVKDISFQVRSGEIFGIAGVQGNGQTELVSAITGLGDAASGMVMIDGNTMPFLNPRAMVKAGMAHIPEDRIKHGLVPSYSVYDNLVLCNYFQPPFAGRLLRHLKKVKENGNDMIARFDIRAPTPRAPVNTLSGGNQQKLILSRELSRDIRILVANQPTRGLDVGSIEFIYGQILALREKGIGILLISTDLDEIMALSDRIAVMVKGRFVEVVETGQVTRDRIGLMMTGLYR